MFQIFKAIAGEITHISCPDCKKKLPSVGIKKDSRIEGLTFKCPRCGALWEVKTE